MSKLVKKALMVLCAGVFSASAFAATPAPTSSTEGTAPQAMATSGNPAAAQKATHKKRHQRMKACMKKGGSKQTCKKMMAKKHRDQVQKQQNKPAAQQ